MLQVVHKAVRVCELHYTADVCQEVHTQSVIQSPVAFLSSRSWRVDSAVYFVPSESG